MSKATPKPLIESMETLSQCKITFDCVRKFGLSRGQKNDNVHFRDDKMITPFRGDLGVREIEGFFDFVVVARVCFLLSLSGLKLHRNRRNSFKLKARLN